MIETFNKITTITLLFLIVLLFNFNFHTVLAAVDCVDVLNNPNNHTPQDLIRCTSPTDVQSTTASAMGLSEIIGTINNVLATLAVFISLISFTVGIIKYASASNNKGAIDEAKTIMTNSVLAFIIAGAIWLITRIVLNTIGLGGLIN